jgi:alpha-tubulin suppressor-like RCC1 family protein
VLLAVGVDFSLAITVDGGLWAWGGNDYGQLGDGTTASRLHAEPVTLLRGMHVVAAAAARYHGLVVTAAGQVFAWGRNHFGQLGDGTKTDRHAPVRIAIPGHVTGVAAGTDHTVAVTADGTAYAWGINNAGQLGDGTTTSRLVPTKVRLPGGTRLAAVDAGNDHTLALTANGRVVVWGNAIVTSAASSPHLRPTDPSLTPVVLDARLFGGSQVVAVGGGDNHATALTRDGRLWVWGRNSHGQLGDGTGQDRRTPAVVRLPASVRAVRTAGNLLLAQTTAGDVYAWGENRFGQLGDGSTKTRGTPARVDALHGAAVTDIAAGPHVGVAVVSHGPPLGLLLQPTSATARPNQRVAYSVHARDAFGNDLGRYDGTVTLAMPGGRVSGLTAWADGPGRYTVTATAGTLTGRAVLNVTGPHPTPTPGHSR